MTQSIGGRYEFDLITDIIGRGGMGAVYRAKDTISGNRVAIKHLKSDFTNDEAIRRFKQEADILGRLSHPHVITVLDVISDDELGYYLVMEYIGGGSLWDELQSYPQLPIPRILSLAKQMASALIAVHAQGIIHRDIKPSNILIADDKSVRLCDFGVGQISYNERITKTGDLVGTLDYIAPEMLTSRPATQQSDIWAFGVTLYEMIAGKRPFYADSVGGVINAILNTYPADLAKLRPDAPENLVALVEWMLLKDPDDRVADMVTVQQILDEISTGAQTSTRLREIQTLLKANKGYKRVGSLPKLFTDDTFHDREYQQALLTNTITERQAFIGVYGRGGIGKTALVSKVLGDYEKRGEANGVAYLRADTTPPINITTLWDALCEFLPDDNPFHNIRKDTTISISEKTGVLLDSLTGGFYVLFVDNLETIQDVQNHAIHDNDIRQFFEAVLDKQGNNALCILITSRYPIPFPNILKPYESSVRLDSGLPPADAIKFLRGIDKSRVLPDEDDQLHLWIEKVGSFPRGLEALVGYLSGGETRHIDDLLDDSSLFEGEVLDNIVRHAHDALPADFRKVLAGVAVIGQATTRAELEYLLTPYIDSAHLRIILEKLVDGRFLLYNRQIRTYSLHPIDLAYVLSSTEKGSARDDETTFSAYVLHQRMANYFASHHKPKEAWKSLDDLQPQLREIEHRYAMGDYDGAATVLMAIDTDHLLSWWGHVQLSHDQHLRLHGNIKDTKLNAMNMRILGRAYTVMGQTHDAIPLYEKALGLVRAEKILSEESRLLNSLAVSYYYLGNLDRAVYYIQAGLEIANATQNVQMQGMLTGNLGLTTLYLGDIPLSIEYSQKAITLHRTIDNRMGEGLVLSNLGDAYTAQKQYETALPLHQQAASISLDMNNMVELCYINGSLARNYWFAGDIQTALNTLRQARQYDTRKNNFAVAAWHGCVAYCAGAINEAQLAFANALAYVQPEMAKSPPNFEAVYAKALTHVGLWLITGDILHRTNAVQTYQQAKILCGYAGVLLEQRHNLEAVLRCGDKDGADLTALLW